MLSRKFREGCLDDVQALLQVFLETITGIIGLSLLDFHHHAERLSGLMWSEFVDEMMHVNEEEADVVDLILSFRAIR